MTVRSAPAITRVHTLHRIRTVVNHVLSLQLKKEKIIDDFAVARHLIKTRLSKPTTRRLRDQIGRRARDHLETARYLGLLYRYKIDGKFTHKVTSGGTNLSKSFENECPANIDEEAILINKLCRLKLANATYLQTPRGHEHYRTRPCLNILASLNCAGAPLSVFQLGYILNQNVLDVTINKEELEALVRKVQKRDFETEYLSRLSAYDKRNIKRNTYPFIDWCSQLNLVRKEDNNVAITQRGEKVTSNYENTFPLWWPDLGSFNEIISAIIILVNYFKIKNKKDLIDGLFDITTKWRLIPVSIRKELKKALKKEELTSLKDDTLFDFSFDYDIPPESWSEINDILAGILKQLGYQKFRLNAIHTTLDNFLVSILVQTLREEAEEYTRERKIPIQIPSVAITSQFKSPYEGECYVFLKVMEKEDFKTAKYQKQLADFFEKRHWKKFAEDNPDLLVTNNFWALIECKSTREWGERFKPNKKIMAEISYYNDYAKEVIATGLKSKCKSIFLYEGLIDPKEKEELEKSLREDFPNVFIVTRKVLQRALTNQEYRSRFRDILKIEADKIDYRVIDA